MLDSNITVVNDNKFEVPKGCTIHPEPENGVFHGKYIIRGKYNEVVAIYNFENGKREGECRLYDCGSLVEKFNYEHDVAKGWGIGIERYKEVKWYLYENNEKKVECVKSDELEGYWEMWDNGVKVKCCKLDDDKKECGVGYVFEEGRIARVVEYVNGEEVRVLKKFEEGEMTEYDEKGDVVYVGDYCGNMKDGFCREGKRGMEIREGELVYVGEWKKGKRDGFGKSLVDGFAEYEGEWKENLPDGEGVFVENDEIKYEGKWERGFFKIKDGVEFNYEKKEIKGLKTIDISNEDELRKIINGNDEKKVEVKELIVNEDSCNDIHEDLVISGFENLEKIVFKWGCLQYLNSLKICDNDELKIIEIEDGDDDSGCLYFVENVIIESS